MPISDDDPFEGMPAAPGMRWVEVKDERTTHRVRWEQIPLDAPDPVEEPLSPEQLARIRRLSRQLRERGEASEAKTNPTPPTTEEPA